MYPDEGSSVMAIIQLDSIMAPIDSLKDIFTGYHDLRLSQSQREGQVQNESIAVLPGGLDQRNYIMKENARCLSLEGSYIPMESAHI